MVDIGYSCSEFSLDHEGNVHPWSTNQAMLASKTCQGLVFSCQLWRWDSQAMNILNNPREFCRIISGNKAGVLLYLNLWYSSTEQHSITFFEISFACICCLAFRLPCFFRYRRTNIFLHWVCFLYEWSYGCILVPFCCLPRVSWMKIYLAENSFGEFSAEFLVKYR